MKNYIRDVIDRYIKHDYPEEVNQDFRTWLTDEERADEKEHELNNFGRRPKLSQLPVIVIPLERMHELRESDQDRTDYSYDVSCLVG